MRVEDLEQALQTAADHQPPVKCDLDAVQEGGRRRQRTRALGLSVVGVGVVAALGASLVVWNGGRDDDRELSTSGVAPVTGRWEELPAPPLSPRSRVVGVWTGSEVLFVGGDTWLCPPGADCAGPDEPPLADGAILDPDTETWRSIASAPVPFSYAATAVLGEDVYFLASRFDSTGPAFLRYSLPDDEWHELPLPPGEAGYALVAAGDRLVAVAGSDEQGEVPDQVFDPGAGTWSALPADPLSPSFDRSMVWADPYLYLFDKELVAQPGSDGPSVTRVARLVPGTDDWERLPDSEIISAAPWYAEGDLLVNPQLGGADGGEVGNYGRTYPNGGILHTDTQTWTELPEASSESSAGVVGARGGLIHSGFEGLLLDLASMTWIEMPAIPGAGLGPYVSYAVVPAGRDAVAFGGEDWSTPTGELLGDAWIWRTAETASSSASTTTEAPDATTTTTTTTESTPPGGDACPALDGSELVVGDHALTVIPPGFTPDGEVTESSTGFVDNGGEVHAIQRFTDPAGRWIEFDSFGIESPIAYIEEMNAGVQLDPTTYPRCVDLTSGAELSEYSLTVAAHDDRWIVGAQEWEYGGFTITSSPDVEVDDLLAIASGLRTPTAPG